MAAGIPAWGGRRVTEGARPYINSRLPMPCGQCGELVTRDQEWNVGHIISRRLRPDLAWQPTNWRAEHRRCSDASSQSTRLEAEDTEADQLKRRIYLLFALLTRRCEDAEQAAEYRRQADRSADVYGLDADALNALLLAAIPD